MAFSGAATGLAGRIARGKGTVGLPVGCLSERPLVGPELGTISGEDAEAPAMSGLILLPDVLDDVAHAAQWYDEEGGHAWAIGS